MLLFRCWLVSVYPTVRVFCFLDVFIPQTMPSLESSMLRNCLVTTCYFLLQSIPTKLSDAVNDNESPRKSEGHRSGTIGKTEIEIENCEPETKFCISFSFFFS